MEKDFYFLNSFKTDAILVATDQQEQQSPITNITFSSQNIPLSASVCNLGVKIDSYLTFDANIKYLCTTSLKISTPT